MRTFVAFLAAALFAVPALAAPQRLDAVVHGVADASKPISESAGGRFIIALNANLSTGYSWTAAVRGNAISVEGSAYQAPVTAAMGAGGQQLFVFDALRKGTAAVTFSYRRPWEHNAAAAKSVTFTVIVK